MYVPAFPADRIHYQVKMCKDSHIDLGFHSAEAEERISMQQSKAEKKYTEKHFNWCLVIFVKKKELINYSYKDWACISFFLRDRWR